MSQNNLNLFSDDEHESKSVDETLHDDYIIGSNESIEKSSLSSINTEQEDLSDSDVISDKTTIINEELKELEEIESNTAEAEDKAEDKNDEPYLWSTIEKNWNIIDLYSRILFALLHTLPADEQPESEESIFTYLQQVFHIEKEVHLTILKSAKERLAPSMKLIVEVIEATGLHGKDANGLSDPLCIIYIKEDQRYNTSVKPETLAPVWKEHFTLNVTSIEDEAFNLEIWDYDPPESISKKLKRIKEVNSTKGLKILMKDIVTTKSSSKKLNQNDFMGSMNIALNKIPSRGFEKWFPIEGKLENGCKKIKGKILLNMKLTTEKDKNDAIDEYLQVYHFLLIHELNEQNIAHHQWNGQFINNFSDYILHQLEWQGGLKSNEIDLTKWFAFARVQCVHPINSNLFPNLFLRIVTESLDKQLLSVDEERRFWFTTETLVENYITFIANIHEYFLNNSKLAVQVNEQLRTLGFIKYHISNCSPGQIWETDRELKLSAGFIVDNLKDEIYRGANELYVSSSQTDPNLNETQIHGMIKIAQILNADLQTGLETSHDYFKKLLGIDYFEITYRVYDEKFGQIVSPIIDDVCKDLKRLDLKEADGDSVEDDLSMGTILFQLYVAVRQFADFSSNVSSQNNFRIAGEFHGWFYASVAQWLDIAFYKGVNRIKKAVDLDTFRATDKYVQRSSSAIDTAHVFHQIQEFWAQLAWPEPEGSYTFIAKILDELCRCNVLYSETMCKKLEQLERGKSRSGDKYEISDELCCAVNNIEYLGQEMSCISEKLGKEKILNGLTTLKGESISAQCERTLESVIENANESINDKLYGLLEKVGYKIRPPLERLFKKAIESTNEQEGIAKLMKYLDDTLTKLKTRTSVGGFEKIFAVIWETTSIALNDLVQRSIQKRRTPASFSRILTISHIIINFFYPNEVIATEVMENEHIKILFGLLEVHAASTPELILKYQQSRYEYQTSLPPKPGSWGIVTIRAQYCVDVRTLKIEVLNARNLIATDSNGSSDPFVKVRIVPRQMYPTISKFRTGVQKETLFPLFDEVFSIDLSAEEMDRAGLIHFLVKDHDVIGQDDFLGEAFLPLGSIPVTKSITPLKDLPQKNLVLHNPSEWSKPILEKLENRQRDKVALNFVKKEKSKVPPAPE